VNDLGSLATKIITYSFPDDTGNFSISFTSGWLGANIGQLNGLTDEGFYVDSTGAFGPSGLCLVEQDIYGLLFESYYYQRSARNTLRNVAWSPGTAAAMAESVILTREGDSTIQRVSNHTVAKTFQEMANSAQSRLMDILALYRINKATPVSVAGEDGASEYVEPYYADDR
jgi:hypothetical protein